MTTAESVDHLGQDQDLLARAVNSDPDKPADLAARQRTVAESIARIQRAQETTLSGAATQPSEDDPNWRGRAISVILAAQEQLAAVPQDLAAVSAAAAAKRDADARAAGAKRDAANATPEAHDAADRAAAQARRDALDAAERVDRALSPITAEVAVDLMDRLKPFAPEAAGAHDLIGQSLLPALQSLDDAAANDDDAGLEHAAADVRAAIELTQKELSRAQDSFVQRDPLVAAKWFARAAADSLARGPAENKTSQIHQSNTSAALSHAWDRSIHRASEQRLALLPSLQNVYGPVPAAGDRPPTIAAPSSPSFSASRDWGRLRTRDHDELDTSMPNPDPPGYEEPLRLYFEALERSQQATEKKK
jgi:hypothetical protein